MRRIKADLNYFKNKKIWCYCVGGDFKYFFDCSFSREMHDNILGCIDNDKSKQGRRVTVGEKEYTIYNLEYLRENYNSKDIIFIASIGCSNEIYESLSADKILSDADCVCLYDLYYEYTYRTDVIEILKENEKKPPVMPKVIHWCWFGGGSLPPKEIQCLETWEKYCQDYEVIKWDESNFDICMNDYVEEAYKSKKYAFVSDFLRLWVLYNYGGIYLDADVEVKKNLDVFLCHNAFSGFEDNINIPTGIMGAAKGSEYIEYLLSYYEGRHFIVNGEIDKTTNVKIITDMTYSRYGINEYNNYINVEGVFTMYPREVFCPINVMTRELNETDNTYAIHRFSGSWT